MTDLDTLKICVEWSGFLDERKRAFVRSIDAKKRMKRDLHLSPAQAQYLRACYDQAVSRKFKVEPMATDREFAASRAVAKRPREYYG